MAIRTHDCKPTLTDEQVLDFCRKGYLVLEAVVPGDVNERSCELMDRVAREGLPHETILEQDWFVDGVLLNPAAAGAVRSLLGRNFRITMPFLHNHRTEEANPKPQGWHRDGGSKHTPHELDSLQVFYYPQDVPGELGPTEVLPGSHLLYAASGFMQHYRSFRGAVSTAAPAGSIFLTAYNLWHRRSASAVSGTRNLLKYWYVRTCPPRRDWIVQPDFPLMHAYHPPDEWCDHREGHRARDDHAGMFFWLCGEYDKYLAERNNLPVYYLENDRPCSYCGGVVR